MLCRLIKKLINFIFNCNKVDLSAPFQDTDPKWLDIAYQELGVSEIAGENHNKRIIEYHLTTSLKASSDEVPWCSSYLNWVFKQVGIKGTNSAMAKSWLDWGEPIIEPVRGCVVVLWRKNKSGPWGHVGFYVKRDKKYIYLLSGNINNRVTVSKHSKDKILGYRMPKTLTHQA